MILLPGLRRLCGRMEENMLDVIVIGAGVTGCATARELSRYDLKAAVLEREEDVCCGTSKANSAIIHAGYDAEPGTLKARMNVQGNRMMDALSKELDFRLKEMVPLSCASMRIISPVWRSCGNGPKQTESLMYASLPEMK